MKEKKPDHKIPIPTQLYKQIEDIARQKGLTVDQQVIEFLRDFLQKVGKEA